MEIKKPRLKGLKELCFYAALFLFSVVSIIKSFSFHFFILIQVMSSGLISFDLSVDSL